MSRRDLALIALAGLCAVLVTAGVLVLATRPDMAPEQFVAALGAITSVSTLGGVAIGRIGPPASTPAPETV